MSAARTLERLRPLLGTWKGRGEGRYPTIDPFRYEETLVFRHREDTDYITYEQTAHLVDEHGRFLEPSHWEAGAIRAEDDGALTLSSAHDSLRVEVMRGTVEGDGSDVRIRLDSTLHANDPRMVASAREIRMSGADLSYTMNMATRNTPRIQTHLQARLRRESRVPAASPAAAGAPVGSLAAQLGRIDVYLFDQILRGRVRSNHTILDAGCGGGRNLHYLMKQGADVHGVDTDPDAVGRVRALAAAIAPDLPADNFRNAAVEDLPYADGAFDVVLSNAVLHFARDEDHFAAMFREMWRVLRPSGVLFVRLASSIGVEDLVTRTDGRWHRLPDGSDRFLVDEAYLARWTEEVGGTLLDPVKTSVVQNLRSMTTWVVGKDA